MNRKIIILVLGAALAVFAGIEFYQVAPSSGARGRKLGRHPSENPRGLFPQDQRVRSTIATSTCSKESSPADRVLVLGGSHAEEPSTRLAAWILAENGVLEQGRLFRRPFRQPERDDSHPAERRLPGFLYDSRRWGGRKFRMGDRWANPLDQWPDPEVYIHYPTGQNLAYMDGRNLNRAWPGRADGTLTEKTTFAFMELIRREKIDFVIDLHEAELQYPVISTIVAHPKGQDLAAMASMILTGEEFKIGVEYSPEALRGLSHREIGDHSDSFGLLFETPEPFLDATRGRTDAKLLLEGKDDFVVRAGKRGLLFEKIDENGWPIDVRVGRHLSTILSVIDLYTTDHPDRGLVLKNIPRYAEIIAKGNRGVS